MRVLVTGAAGFIASNLVDELLAQGHEVVGLDNFDPYYDPEQKRRNLLRARAGSCYRFVELDVRALEPLAALFDQVRPELVVHLAARAGVRASVDDPRSYVEVNELGGVHVLMQAVRLGNIPVVYASTSSVYGKQAVIPFGEDDTATTPLSPYAASKRSGELMVFSFHEVYQLPVAILRFFTVYGPRGRPDMAFFKFSEAMVQGTPITLHGEDTERDFTFVGDIVAGVIGAMDWVMRTRGLGTFNLGRSEPVVVRRAIEMLGAALGRSPNIVLGKLQPGEAFRTRADVTLAHESFGYQPKISLEQGIEAWVRWLKDSPEAPPMLR